MLLLKLRCVAASTPRVVLTSAVRFMTNITPREVNALTKEIFRGSTSNFDKKLCDHLKLYVFKMSSANIAEIIFLSSKKGVKLNHENFTLMTKGFQRKKRYLNAAIVSKILHGCRIYNNEDKYVLMFIRVLTRQISLSKMVLDGQGVGNCLYGLQRMSSDSDEVKGLLSELRRLVDQCPDNLSSQEIGNSLYGLKNMSSECCEVRALLSTLSLKILKASEELSGQTIGNGLYGMQNMNSDYPEVRQVLSAFNKRIRSSKSVLRSQEIGNAFYGLQCMSAEHPEVCAIVKSLGSKIRSSNCKMTPQEISSAFYGLQGMSSEFPEIRQVLDSFSKLLERVKPALDGQAIGNILYGMKCMTSEHKVVRDVLKALVRGLVSDENILGMSAQEISNAMYGMQCMEITDVEVQMTLKFLRRQLLACKHDFSGQAVSNMIFGLQNKNCNHEVVRSFLSTVSEKMQLLREPMNLFAVGVAMYGLRSANSEVAEVRTFLRCLHEKCSVFKDDGLLEEQVTRSICNALYGMQCMDSQHYEVRCMLGMLSDRLKTCSPTTMTAQGFGNAMYGMQQMTCRSDHPEVLSMFRTLIANAKSYPQQLLDHRAVSNSLYGLISAIKSSTDVQSKELLSQMLELLLDTIENIIRSFGNEDHKLSPVEVISADNLMDLWRSLVLFSYFTNSSQTISESVRNRLAKLCSELSNAIPHSTLHVNYDSGNGEVKVSKKKQVNTLESRVQEQVNIILQDNPTVHITYNEMLYGFESDIVLRVTNGGTIDGTTTSLEPAIIHTIEVDGIAHLQPRKRKYCHLRDIYLRDQYGIEVSRIRLTDRKCISDKKLQEAVTNHLQSIRLFATTQQMQHTFF